MSRIDEPMSINHPRQKAAQAVIVVPFGRLNSASTVPCFELRVMVDVL
jgi:hypothetical protein